MTVGPPLPFPLLDGLEARTSLAGSDCIGCDYELRFQTDGTVEMISQVVSGEEGTYELDELDARLVEVRAMIAEDASDECDGDTSHQQTLSIAVAEGSLRACLDGLSERLVPFLDFVRSTRGEIEQAWAAELAEVEPIVIVTRLPPGCTGAGCDEVTSLFVGGRWEDSSGGSGVFDPSNLLDANERFHTEEGHEHIWLPDPDMWGEPCTAEESAALSEFHYEIGFVQNVTDRSAVVRCENDLYRFQPTIAAIDDALREIAGQPPSQIDPRAISRGIDGGPDLVSYASPLQCLDCRGLS